MQKGMILELFIINISEEISEFSKEKQVGTIHT